MENDKLPPRGTPPPRRPAEKKEQAVLNDKGAGLSLNQNTPKKPPQRAMPKTEISPKSENEKLYFQKKSDISSKSENEKFYFQKKSDELLDKKKKNNAKLKKKNKNGKNEPLNKVETLNDSRAENPYMDRLKKLYQDNLNNKKKINYILKPYLLQKNKKKKYLRVLFLTSKIDRKKLKPILYFYSPVIDKSIFVATATAIAISKLKIVALVLCILGVIGGGIGVGSYYLFRNKGIKATPYVYKNNVSINVGKLELENGTYVLPGGELTTIEDFYVSVPDNTDEIKYDICAYAITFSAKFINNGENALPYLGFKFSDMGDVFNTLDSIDGEEGYYRLSDENKTVYFTDILGPGMSKRIVDSIYISKELENDVELYRIEISYSVKAIYPNEENFIDKESKFSDAPEGWKKLVIENASNYQEK